MRQADPPATLSLMTDLDAAAAQRAADAAEAARRWTARVKPALRI